MNFRKILLLSIHSIFVWFNWYHNHKSAVHMSRYDDGNGSKTIIILKIYHTVMYRVEYSLHVNIAWFEWFNSSLNVLEETNDFCKMFSFSFKRLYLKMLTSSHKLYFRAVSKWAFLLEIPICKITSCRKHCKNALFHGKWKEIGRVLLNNFMKHEIFFSFINIRSFGVIQSNGPVSNLNICRSHYWVEAYFKNKNSIKNVCKTDGYRLTDSH